MNMEEPEQDDNHVEDDKKTLYHASRFEIKKVFNVPIPTCFNYFPLSVIVHCTFYSSASFGRVPRSAATHAPLCNTLPSNKNISTMSF